MNTHSPIRFLHPVRLKHKETGKYLYSTDVRYQHPGSSGQQMVGAAKNPDGKFEWVFKHPNSAQDAPLPGHSFSTADVVRIEHIETRKNLHTHQLKSQVSGENEVTCFGGLGVGDPNDDWELSVLAVMGDGSSAEVSLKHVQTNSFLRSLGISLPTPPIAESDDVSSYPEHSNPNNVWVVERVDKPSIQLSKISTRIEIPERFIAFSIESSTSMDAWVNAADEWIKKEEATWAWLTSLDLPLAGLGISFDSPSNLFQNGFRQLSASVREIANNLDANNLEASLSTLEQTFKRIYAKHDGLIFSGEPAGVFSCGYGATKPIEATVAVAVLTGRDPVVNSATAVKGVNAAVSFLEGKHEQFAQAHKEALDGLRQSWEASAKTTLAGAQSNSEAAEDRIRTLDAKAGAFDKQAEKLIADKTASIAALEDSLRKKVALDDSINYWRNRARVAGSKATKIGSTALLSIILSIVSIIYACSILFGSADSDQKQTSMPGPVSFASTQAPQTVITQSVPVVQGQRLPDATTKPVVQDDRSKQYWRYLVIAVMLTFEIWICRLLVRITMSNLHASADAEERVTMLQTFLSLLSDGSINRQEDVKLILQTVFRPGTTGLIHEESGMQTPLEMVLKTISGGEKSPDK